MAIARHVVEAHSGSIWAKPTVQIPSSVEVLNAHESLGGGLTVVFTLPVAVSN